MAPPSTAPAPRPDRTSEPVILAFRLPAAEDRAGHDPRAGLRPAPRDLPPADELQKWLDLSG
jgi:hypothetical protein